MFAPLLHLWFLLNGSFLELNGIKNTETRIFRENKKVL
jgi:hypothetical protein